jgi:hypothetical protein
VDKGTTPKQANQANDSILSSIGQSPCVVFAFDTTVSMKPCLQQVRAKIHALSRQMFQDFPESHIGMIAHGDYCDGYLCVQAMRFTRDPDDVANFIARVPDTGGGDSPECYEKVLQVARRYPWPEKGGALLLVGDASPHPPQDNPEGLDWKVELQKLLEQEVRVFSLQCLYRQDYREANDFWGGWPTGHGPR